MKKANMIGALVLGVIIIILIIMLSISPMMKKDEAENIDVPNEEVVDVLPDNIASIQLGINHLVTGDGVDINNTDVVIKQGGTYNISGTLIDGTIYIDTKELVLLNKTDVNINTSKEALIIKESKEVTININGNNYIKGTNIMSDGNILLRGTGSLNINASINVNELSQVSGNVVLNSNNIRTNEKINIVGGSFISMSNNTINLTEKQNALILKLDSIVETNSSLALVKEDGEEVITFDSSASFNNLVISTSSLNNGNYYLYKNYNRETKEGERIKVNITDMFIVDKILNIYGISL